MREKNFRWDSFKERTSMTDKLKTNVEVEICNSHKSVDSHIDSLFYSVHTLTQSQSQSL